MNELDLIKRLFSYSELFGPFSCEAAGCENEHCYMIVISTEEFENLPPGRRENQAAVVCKNQIGRVVCQKHLKEWKQNGGKHNDGND